MAELSEKIAITGGEEITRTFNQIGASGEQAFKRIEQAVAGGIKSARSFGNAFEDQVRHVLELGFAVKKLTDFIASGAEAGQRLQNTAQSIGLTTDELSGLGFAAGQAGLDFDKFTTLVGRFDRAIGEAQRAAREFAKDQRNLNLEQSRASEDLRRSQDRQRSDATKAASLSEQQSRQRSDLLRTQSRQQEDLNRKIADSENIFTRFGVKTTDAAGKLKTTNDLLLEVADRFAAIPDSAQKSSDAFATFGRAAGAIIPFLNKGRAGIEEYIATQKRLAPELTKTEQAIGTDFNNAVRLLDASVTSVKNSFLTIIAEPLTPFFKELAEQVARNREGFLGIATVLAGKLKETLQTFLQFLNQNPQALVEGVKATTTALVSLGKLATLVVKSVKAIFDTLKDVFDSILPPIKNTAKAIDETFGTNLSAKIKGIDSTTLAWAATLSLIIFRVGLITAAVDLLKKGLIAAGLIGGGAVAAGAAAGGGAAGGAIAAVATAGTLAFKALAAEAVVAGAAIVQIAKDMTGTGGAAGALEQKMAALTKEFHAGAITEDVYNAKIKELIEGFGKTGASAVKTTTEIDAIKKKMAEADAAFAKTKQTVEETGVSFIKFGIQSSQAINNSSARIIHIGDGAKEAFKGITVEAQSAADILAQAFVDANTRVAASFETLFGPGGEAALDDLDFSDEANALIDAFTTANDTVAQSFQDLEQKVSQVFDSVEEDARSAAQIVDDAFNDLGNFGGGGQAGGFASGGQVHGRPGRDKIPAWLTNREFVHKTAAVDYYGVRFMHAINRMQIPRDMFKGFNLGGLVSIPTQKPLRFANGGQATSGPGMRPLSLTIGADTFAGLLAPEAVAQKLIKAAGARALNSAGRKPSGYGG